MTSTADENAFAMAFLDACQAGELAQIYEAITSGELTEEYLDKGLVRATGKGITPGYVDIVSALFAAGARITPWAINALHGEDLQQDPATSGEPVLGFIIDLACAREFLSQGTKPNAFGPSKTTALYRALDTSNVKLAKLLIAYGAKLEPDLLWATVGYRKQSGELTIKFLLNKGVNPNQAISEKWGNPLHLAASAANPNIVKMLLDAGADRTILSPG